MNGKNFSTVLCFVKRAVIARNHPMETVAGAAFVLAFFGILSRILGLVRDRILASTFGAGDVLDVYYAAFRIPDVLYSLLVLGALSAAFIPVFTEVFERSTQKKAWELASSVLIVLTGALVGISILAIIFLPWIVQGITPGFSSEKQKLVEEFSRILFLSPIFLGASAVMGGILVSRRCFWTYSVAPLFYNAGIIFGATVGIRLWGEHGLAWGVVIGAFLHFVTQFISARKIGFVFIFRDWIFWKSCELKKIVTLMIPRTLTVAANQINLFITTIFASTLAEGSLSVFNFANNLQSIPLALFGISFATAVFPRLSLFSAKNDRNGFSHTFYRTLRRILFFVVPVTILIVLLRAQIVRVVLGAGQFNWSDTVLTFQVLGILAVSLFAQSVIPLLARSFYSLHNTKTPFCITLFSEGINVLLSFLLIKEWGIYGLACAFSVSSIVQMSLMFLFLRKQVFGFEKEGMRNFLFRLLFASVIAGACVQGMKSFLGTVTDLSTFWEVFAQLAFSGGLGVVVFLAAARYFRIEEFDDMRKKAAQKIFGSSSQTIERIP